VRRLPCRSVLPLIALSGVLFCSAVPAAERPSYTLNQRAVEQMQQGDYAAAIALLRQALVLRPQHEVVRHNLGQAHLSAGERLISEKHYAEAVEMLQNGKQYDDQESRLWLFRGLALLQLNDYLYAESELNEAWAMSGDEPRVLWLLGRLYYHTDRMQQAVEVWERALELEPDNEMIAGRLSRARRELKVEQEMNKDYAGHFIISYDGELSASLSQDMLATLEDAYAWVGAQLHHYPQRRIPVLVYTDKDFNKLTDSPDWAAGIYDGKIRFPAGGISSVDSRVAGLLFHEYMHAVVHELAGNRVPFWLNEGLAEIAAGEQRPPALEPLERARKEGKLFAWSELEAPARQFDSSRVAVAYLQSYAFVRYLVDEYGWFQMRDLLDALGKGATVSAAIEQTLGVYAVDYRSLQDAWGAAGQRQPAP